MQETKLTLPNEIYKKVAQEHNIDEKAVKYIYDSYISEIHDIANYTDATSIKLPHLGVMYINKKFIESEIHYLARTKNDPEKLEAFREKKAIIDKGIREYGNKPAIKKRLLHVKRARLNNPLFTFGKTIVEIENTQNERLPKDAQ